MSRKTTFSVELEEEMVPGAAQRVPGNAVPAREEASLDIPASPPYSPASADGEGKIHTKEARESDALETVDAEEAESSRNCIQRVLDSVTGVVHKVIPPGGILSSAFTLASGSIGAGILGLPGGSDTSGLAMAMIYLVIITFFSIYSMHLLAIVAEKTNIKTFEGIGRWLFPGGHYAFSYWIAFIRWFYSFGCCVGYVISVGNCFSPIFKEAHKRKPDNKALKYFNSTSGNRLLIALVWLCIMLPLVVPKHIDSLRYASALAVTFMTYFVIVIIIHSCLNGLPVNRHHVIVSGHHGQVEEGNNIFLFRTGNPAMGSLGVFMFAYVCQINALEVWVDFKPSIRTVRNYTYSAMIGMLICGTLYALVCVFGYFDFGSAKLQSNSILLMYDPLSEPYMMVAYVGVLTKLCVSYALLTLAARNSVYYFMGWQQKYRTPRNKRNPVMDSTPATDTVGDDYLPGDSFDMNPTSDDGAVNAQYMSRKGPQKPKKAIDDNVFVDNIPFWQHLLVVVILSTVCLICGLFIPSINIVFGFAGAISGGFLAFIFPALYYMYAGDFTLAKVGYFNYCCTYALLISGVIGVVFGTGATIYSTAGGD